jgi:hypothetical protein
MMDRIEVRAVYHRLFQILKDRIVEYNRIQNPYLVVIRGKRFGEISVTVDENGRMDIYAYYIPLNAKTIKSLLQAIAWVEARIEGLKRYNKNEYRKQSELFGSAEDGK